MSPKRSVARRSSADWKAKHDALLDVLNAILLAHGSGEERRLVVGGGYVGQARREVAVERVPGILEGSLVVYLAPSSKEDTHAR